MATSRLNLRNWLADRLDDLADGQVDSPAIGTLSTTTINDSRFTQVDADFWKGADVTFCLRGSTYETRRVTAYSPTISGLTGGCLTLESALSQTPSTNTPYYLYRKHTADRYNRSLNQAIRRAGESGLVEVLKTNASLVATTDVWEYTVPTGSGITRLLDVFWLDNTNDDEPVPVSKRNWDTRVENGVMTLRFRYEELVASGKTIKLVGAGRPATLETDGAELEDGLPTDFILDYAASELNKAGWQATDPDDAARQATWYQQLAEQNLVRGRHYVRRGRITRRWT